MGSNDQAAATSSSADSAAAMPSSVDPTPAVISLGRDLLAMYADHTGTKQLRFRILDQGFDNAVDKCSLNAFPAVALFEGKPYLTYQNAGADRRLYYSTYDGTNWSAGAAVPNVYLNGSPAMALFDGKLYVTHQRSATDPQLYYAVYNGKYWLPDAPVPNVSLNASPTMGVLDGTLYAVHQGADVNHTGKTICYTTFDGTQWSPDTLVPNVYLVGSPSMAVYKDKLYVAYQAYGRTADPNYSIWCITYDGRNWSTAVPIGWSEFPIYKASSPAIFQAYGDEVWLLYCDTTGIYRLASVTDADGTLRAAGPYPPGGHGIRPGK